MADTATIARPYARAAFDYARGGNALAAWGDVLKAASAALGDERVAALVGNPHVRSADLVTFLLDLIGASTDAHVRNFVHLLADNGRLELLPQIADRLLDAMASGASLQQVHATLDGEGALVCEFA